MFLKLCSLRCEQEAPVNTGEQAWVGVLRPSATRAAWAEGSRTVLFQPAELSLKPWWGLGFKRLLCSWSPPPHCYFLSQHHGPLSWAARSPLYQVLVCAAIKRNFIPEKTAVSCEPSGLARCSTSHIYSRSFKMRRLCVFQMCVTWTSRTKLGTRPSCWPL